MKIHRSSGYTHLDLSSAEARALLEELENVRGGSKLPKVKQICEGLRQSLALREFKSKPAKVISLAAFNLRETQMPNIGTSECED